MSKVKSFQLLFFAMIVLSFLFPLTGQTSIETSEEGEKRPDRIKIQLGADTAKMEMPAVSFMHDLHTDAVEGQCADCHEKEDNAFVFKFKRTDKKASMEFYHDACIACHVEKKSADEVSGPTAAECRTCHVEKEPYGSSWKEIVFDRSLHFAHESSKQIKGQKPSDTENCSSCHHNANEKTKETFYVKGEESACSYCHKPAEKNDVRTIRQASHDSCVACHQSMKDQKIEAGPVTCNGCHEADQQARIKKLTDIPRLKRNQPDEVALTGWKEGSKDKKAFMNAVAFDHKAHEMKEASCKVCHHETLKKCSDCHKAEGGDIQGGFVSLEQAMHSPGSSQSCVGCHKGKTTKPACAGCHSIAPSAKTDSESCATCHNLPPAKFEGGEPSELAKAAISKNKEAYIRVPVDKIPEIVKIDVLAKDYKASEFPHRKVVQAIFKKVEKSNMANAFHKDQAGLCMGCHHNSPKTLEPPKCASCHSKTGPVIGNGSDGRPGLKGAYHGQCITCHQKMEVASVAATDCVKCHEARK